MSTRTRRTAPAGGRARAKRPIDKKLISVEQTLSSQGQTQTDLYTTTFPGTIVGLRWDVSVAHNSQSATVFTWAIVVIPDGNTSSNLGQGNGVTIYAPEQHVLAYGNAELLGQTDAAGPGMVRDMGSTKTMRKMKAGDVLAFIAVCDAPNAAVLKAAVQFFVKT